MWEDPIVAEVHRTREMLAAKYNFDIGAFFADLRTRQASLGNRLVPQKKQAEPLYGLESQEGAPRTGLTKTSFPHKSRRA
jgi:hypothetical protein